MNIMSSWPDAPSNQVMKQQALEHVVPTASEYYGAAAQEAAWANPVDSLARMTELSIAKGSGEDVLQPEQLNREFGMKGELSFDYPMPRKAAQIMMSRKQDEIRVRDTLSRGGGSAVGAFVIQATVAMMDPLNVASMFIPVVGEERAAALTARLGKMGSRALTGFAEGAGGMAMVEPAVFMAADQEQRNYTVYDALFKVGLGGVLGSGLHVGLGAIGDAVDSAIMRRIAPETHDAAIRGGAADLLQGNSIRSGEVLALDRNVIEARAREEVSAQPRFAGREETPVRNPVAKDALAMTKEEFVAKNTKIFTTLEELADEVKLKGSRGFNEEVGKDGSLYITKRGPDGTVEGVLRVPTKDGKPILKYDPENPASPSVWVAEGSRKQGIASELYKQAKARGYDLSDISGRKMTAQGAESFYGRVNRENPRIDPETKMIRDQEFKTAVATRTDELMQEEMAKFQKERQASKPSSLDDAGEERIIEPEEVEDFGGEGKPVTPEEEAAKITEESTALENEARQIKGLTGEEEMVLEKVESDIALVKKRESAFKQATNCVLQFMGYV